MREVGEVTTNLCSMALEEALCCGCSACSLICPAGAIKMEFKNGSYRPLVNYNLCISCGLCVSVCQALQSNAFDVGTPLKQAACHVSVIKDKTVLEKSSSGGVGYSLGNIAVNKGLPYCAASYIKERERCEHVICERIDQLEATQGSKYLPSVCAPAFSDIVRSGKGLIIGTPCQIAGLDEVLRRRKTRDNYILVDIFCHGVPNELLWERHLEWLKKRKGIAENTDVRFREKKQYIITVGSYKAWYNEDAFYTMYLRGWMHNRACYSCRYRRNSRADVRIGDLMAAKYASLPYSPSCVLTLTDRGAKIMDEIDAFIESYKESFTTVDDIQESTSVSIPSNYEHNLSALIDGLAPEQLIGSTMVKGRIKSFIKHSLLERFFRSDEKQLSDIIK